MLKYYILFTIFFAIFLSGCVVRHSSLVIPSTMGDSTNVSQLEKNWKKYKVYYSGPVYNPSAILFLKKDLPLCLRLYKGWKGIDIEKRFKDLMDRIRYLSPTLYVLVGRGKLGPSKFGYLYTTGVTYLKKENKQCYLLLPVEEHFNDIYYGGDRFDRTGRYVP